MSTLNQQLEGSLQLIDKRSAQNIPVEPLSPMQELQMQIVRTGDLEKLKQLREIEREWKADRAKELFTEAMAAFKDEPQVVRILKDKKNKQYGDSPYASLGREASVIVPLLSKHGLSGDWKLSQTDKGITVSYVLTHRAGHSSEPVSITLPPDASGVKNVAQQVKSSITYGRIITLECACGIAPIDSFASLNDDGNAIGQEEQGELDERDYANMVDLIEASRTLDELKVNYRKAQDAAESAKDHSAAKTFAEIKNKMYRKLAKA